MTARSEIRRLMGSEARIAQVGSRITCNPAPSDTDEDWLVYEDMFIGDPFTDKLTQAGFTLEGAPRFYTGSDRGGFRSWRRGNLNIITTRDKEFFDKFLRATALAKRFNLMEKRDRIALFQVVLYDVNPENLE